MPVGNIATAGSGGDYATVGEAVAAGYTEVNVISDTIEIADITYGERLSITFLAEYQVDMVGFQFLATSAIVESWLSITGAGTVRFSYSGTKDLFNSAAAGEDTITHLLLDQVHVLNQSTATKGGICGWASVDTQTNPSAISPLVVARYCRITLPNFANCGFYCFSPDGDLSVALKHHFQEVQFVGGGTTTSGALVSGVSAGGASTRQPNYFRHDQLTFTSTWSTTVEAADISGETLGVTCNSTAVCVLKVSGFVAGVKYEPTSETGGTFKCNGGTFIGIFFPTIVTVSAGTTFVNCSFRNSGTWTIPGGAFYGCYFQTGALTIDSLTAQVRLSNCLLTVTGGGITFKTVNAIIEGCQWNQGSGNITFDAASSGTKWLNNVLEGTAVAVTITDNGTNNFIGSPLVMRTKADQTINGNAYQNITRLSFPVAAAKDYMFEFNLVFRSVTITTGFGFSINGPALGTGDVSYVTTYQLLANAAGSTDIMAQRHDTAYDAMAALLATVTAGVNLHCNIKGRLRNGATAGTLAARVRSELANNDLVVQKGSWGTWLELT